METDGKGILPFTDELAYLVAERQHQADVEIVNKWPNPYPHSSLNDYHIFEDARCIFLKALKAAVK